MATTPEGTPYVEASDLVANYPAASLSLANRVDLVGVLPFADSAARATAIPSPTDGQFTYLQDTKSTEFYNGSAFQALAGGKILQVVRATDATDRSTSSSSFVDASISVTITPQKSTSAILLLWFFAGLVAAGQTMRAQITDNSNNALSGAENAPITNLGATQAAMLFSLLGRSTPATTSATTYKGRFRGDGSSMTIQNSVQTGQLYAIEVSA
jgi:hypothetical protein